MVGVFEAREGEAYYRWSGGDFVYPGPLGLRACFSFSLGYDGPGAPRAAALAQAGLWIKGLGGACLWRVAFAGPVPLPGGLDEGWGRPLPGGLDVGWGSPLLELEGHMTCPVAGRPTEVDWAVEGIASLLPNNGVLEGCRIPSVEGAGAAVASAVAPGTPGAGVGGALMPTRAVWALLEGGSGPQGPAPPPPEPP